MASDSGIVTLAKPLDRELRAMYNLTVQAVDQGTPIMSSVVSLIVNVQDINDNPPEFASKYYFAVVPEIDAVGTEVARVLATSKDTVRIAYFPLDFSIFLPLKILFFIRV